MPISANTPAVKHVFKYFIEHPGQKVAANDPSLAEHYLTEYPAPSNGIAKYLASMLSNTYRELGLKRVKRYTKSEGFNNTLNRPRYFYYLPTVN